MRVVSGSGDSVADRWQQALDGLHLVRDLASRRLAGWAVADHMRVESVIDALKAAERTRGSLAGAIFHTRPRGSIHSERLRRGLP